MTSSNKHMSRVFSGAHHSSSRRATFAEVVSLAAAPVVVVDTRPAASALAALLSRQAASAQIGRRSDPAATATALAAQAEHAALLAAAESEAREAGWNAGWAAGSENGYRAGLADGSAAGLARLDQAATGLAAAAAAFDERSREVAVLTEDRIADVAFRLTESLVGHELAIASASTREAVARALALVPEGDAVVRLNPDDAECHAGYDFGRSVSVVADPAVAAGGCMVSVGVTTIDGRLDVALERVRQILQPQLGRQ
jgi:flagellar assembly protein FliH